MTCIVLTKNPHGGGILAITDNTNEIESEEIAQWPNADKAKDDLRNHTLIRAWGGWVVDLDNEEVSSL